MEVPNERTPLSKGGCSGQSHEQEIARKNGSIQTVVNHQEGVSVQNKPLGRNRKRIDKSLFRLLGATICIVIAIATWVTMAEKLQGLNKHYKNHQYFNTYWVHSCYTVLYILWKIWVLFPGGFSCNKVGEGSLVFDKKFLFWSGFIALSGYVSAYLWYISLTSTNIPANTAIYQSGAALVFVISVPLLKERVTLLKVVCVFLSIAGVSLVAFFSTAGNCDNPLPIHNGTNTSTAAAAVFYNDNDYDSDDGTSSSHLLGHISHGGDPCAEKSTPLGYILLVISVLCYAIFETFYKKFGTKKDDPASVANGIRFVGIVGIHTLVWMWPPIIILHYAGVEPFEWPDLQDFRLLVLNATLDVVFNGALLVAIALSSPLFVTVGTILAIPTSVVVDWIVQGELLSWQAFLGIVLIIIGFAGFTFSELVATRRERRHRLQREKVELEVSCRDRLCQSSKSNDTDPLLHSGQNDELKRKFSLREWIKQNFYWI